MSVTASTYESAFVSSKYICRVKAINLRIFQPVSAVALSTSPSCMFSGLQPA